MPLKFELANQDSAGEKSSTVLISIARLQERYWCRETFLTGDSIEYQRKRDLSFQKLTISDCVGAERTKIFRYLQNEHTLPPKSASKSCPYKSDELQSETFAGPACETKQSLLSALKPADFFISELEEKLLKIGEVRLINQSFFICTHSCLRKNYNFNENIKSKNSTSCLE